MLELLLGLWCSPVRWELREDVLIYSRTLCFRGDNYLMIEKDKFASPRATCALIKVERIGDNRWKASGEMAYAAWMQCSDSVTSWQQKMTFLENGYLKVLSNWVEYTPGYAGPGRTLIRW